jgi:hypothetical protein
VGSAELVSQAIAELYGTDLATFTKRRAELAAQARAAGEPAVAKQIAGLRKPTRSAWVVNQLVRADPTAPTQLATLAAEFKAGQAAADGTALRRLSQQRRMLIDALIRQALAIAGEADPSATLREEVTATLAAALADPEVASTLAAGTLTRAEQRAEFGSFADVTAQPPPARGQVPDASHATDDAARAANAGRAAQAESERQQAERAARAERERQQAIADAEQAVENARQAEDAATQAEREQEQAVRLLEEQLVEARQRLQQARLRSRQASSVHANAARALRRLPR